MATVVGRRAAGAASAPERRVGGYLTVRETAEVLNMHFMSVYKLVQSGQLPALKIGSRWKIDPEQLETWVSRRRGVSREWLLVAVPDLVAAALEEELGLGHHLRRVSFAGLAEAVAERPDVVVVTPEQDHHAALAALALCRTLEPPPLCLLAVDRPNAALVADALTHGIVTLMPCSAGPAVVAQLESLLQAT